MHNLKYRLINWLLKTILKNEAKIESDIEMKTEIIGNYFGVPNYLTNKTRKREYVKARQILATILVDNTPLTLTTIGNHIWGSDHSIVIYSHKVIDNIIDTDRRFKYEFFKLIRKMNLEYSKYQVK